MAQMGRPGLSATQKKELWARWRAGESLSDIGRALGKHPGSIHGVVKMCGGIVPAARIRSMRVLSLGERGEISRGLACKDSVRGIAAALGRAPSTVSREISRHVAAHRQFTIATDVQVYFCDPSSPWQRGSNENTNGLLRQYFPKSTNLSTHSQDQLNEIALRLNTRPRKTLAYATPAAMLQRAVAQTR